MEFAHGLNCIIGGRGTGKTTVMGFIRFALDAMPPGVAARKRIADLVGRNLGDGRIELEVETKDGVVYVWDRGGEDEEPIVRTEDRRPTPIRFREGGLFSADIFSQNEIEDIADEPLAQLSLIDSFEARQIGEMSRAIEEVLGELAVNAGAVVPLRKKVADLSDALAALPGVDEKLRGLAAVGGGDADRVFVMQSDGRSASVVKAGSVDDCRDEIINLLEGGADAFRRRSLRYKC